MVPLGVLRAREADEGRPNSTSPKRGLGAWTVPGELGSRPPVQMRVVCTVMVRAQQPPVLDACSATFCMGFQMSGLENVFHIYPADRALVRLVRQQKRAEFLLAGALAGQTQNVRRGDIIDALVRLHLQTSHTV